MKIFTFLILLMSTFYLTGVKEVKISSSYNCLPNVEKGGRCTGSAYCSACKNCSRCAHCSNGGSCGVCSSNISSEYYTTPKKSKRSSSSSSYSSKTAKTYYKNETITVYNEVINLRKGPGLKYSIIEKIPYGGSVSYILESGEWIKVKVEKTGTIGYINTKLLNQ